MVADLKNEPIETRLKLAGQFELIDALLNETLPEFAQAKLGVSLAQLPAFEDYMVR